MKKDTIQGAIVAFAVLLAYNCAVFMIPCWKGATFWISWGFSLLSFVIAGAAIYFSMIIKTDAKSRFYGFPIAKIGAIYLVAQVAFGGICMALGHIIPWWLATVVDVIGLALVVIGLISAEAVVDEIQVQDVKLEKNVAVMRALQSKVNQMASQSEDTAVRALAEEFRYSDPVSSNALEDIEQDLTAVVDELQAAIIDGDADAAAQLCRKVSAVLAERNRLCKLNK